MSEVFSPQKQQTDTYSKMLTNHAEILRLTARIAELERLIAQDPYRASE